MLKNEKFQFHTGSIRRIGLAAVIGLYCHVSIPHWFD